MKNMQGAAKTYGEGHGAVRDDRNFMLGASKRSAGANYDLATANCPTRTDGSLTLIQEPLGAGYL
jgi:hypothetical protein